ncbi:hypothetical protein [Fodinibius sp.]|uniref:hypothetical protein n=1 Tax=Fodinibius sp. TaxID=1872440 RepID=UPI002ACE2AE9|nr:hypothetical protein [Fodinibius sp.]MDZ7658076.1 hypothetical protein [Fodinibius sp.]
MSATYDITSHPLLSDKAKALYNDDQDAFDAVVVAVERTLGLHGTNFSGEDAEKAKLANVYQINYELEQTTESMVHERIDQGEETWVYRGNLSAKHPRAESLANDLLEEDDSTSSSRSSLSSTAVSNESSW